MTFEPADAKQHRAVVVERLELSRRYFLLRLERPGEMPTPRAGSFLHVAVPESGRFFLRRPFSVHDCDDSFLDLLIVEVGAGTNALRRLGRGDSVDFYGPLGHGFPALEGQRIVAIGGGVGLAPLFYYGFREPGGCGDSYRLLYGARTKEELFVGHFEELRAEGVALSTDDGSHGFEGSVVELAEAELEKEPADVVFSCGPTAMMRSAQELSERLGVPHFVSLENRMACAVGACRACVVPTRLDGSSRYRTVCHDGPVFDAADILWDELPAP